MARKGNANRGLYQRANGKWGACWTDADGQTQRRVIGTKSQAQAYLDARRAEVHVARFHPEAVAVQKTDTTLGEAVTRYLPLWQAKKSWKDEQRFVRFWLEEFGPDRRCSTITPGEIEAWRLRRMKVVSVATVNRAVSFLRRLFNLLDRDGLCTGNPAARLGLLREDNSRVRYLSPDEERAIAAELPRAKRLMMEWAILTGLRLSEQLRVECSHIRDGRLSVPARKGGRTDRLPLHPRAIEIAAELDRGQRYLFEMNGKPWTANSVSQWFRRAVRRAGVADFHWHDLRHTFCSRLVSSGVSLTTVRDLAGHQTVVMTERYAHLSPDHLTAEVSRIQTYCTDTAPSPNGTGKKPDNQED